MMWPRILGLKGLLVNWRMKEYKRTIEEMVELGFYSELDNVMEVFAQMVKIEKLARRKTAERQKKQIKFEF